jgi:hypothetical protein
MHPIAKFKKEKNLGSDDVIFVCDLPSGQNQQLKSTDD